LQALAKIPAHRFADCRQFAAALAGEIEAAPLESIPNANPAQAAGNALANDNSRTTIQQQFENRPNPVPAAIRWGISSAVLLAVAGTVLSVVLPKFSESRAMAENESCLSNLSTMASALNMYVSDYDGLLPQAANWADGLSPYIKNNAVFQCPSLPNDQYGYAYNQQLDAKELSQIDAGSKVAVIDAADCGWNESCGIDKLATRHQGHANVLYASGSCQSATSLSASNFDITNESSEADYTPPSKQTARETPSPSPVQRAAQPPPQTAEPISDDEICDLVNRWCSAWNNMDLGELSNCYDRRLVMINHGKNGTKTYGYSGYMAHERKMFQKKDWIKVSVGSISKTSSGLFI
jgi:type II secretory pathway pseudopilin PulG